MYHNVFSMLQSTDHLNVHYAQSFGKEKIPSDKTRHQICRKIHLNEYLISQFVLVTRKINMKRTEIHLPNNRTFYKI